MNINLNTKVHGRFKFVVRKADTHKISKETDWFDNLVLNQGLDLMATISWFSGVQVGTGNSEPIATQTQLDSRIAQTTKLATGVPTEYGASPISPYFLWRRSTYRFDAGVFNNTNLSEVAIITSSVIATGNNRIWNRALIRDINGNPTTITLLSDEYLDVLCEVRAYFNENDVSSTVDLLDKNNGLINKVNLLTRPADVTKAFRRLGDELNAIGSFLSSCHGSKNPIAAINLAPSGSEWGTASYSGLTAEPYVSGSNKLNFKLLVPINQADGVAIRSVYMIGMLGNSQTEFTPPITKNNTQTFTINYTLSWGRYTS